MPKTKKCHYISQIYLKSWSDNGSSIKVYNKENKKLQSISIENNFYKIDLYNFKFNMLTYAKNFPLIYDDFKKMIKNFMSKNNIIIFYKNKQFNIATENLGHLLEKENIDFFQDNIKLNKRKKNQLYNELSQLKSTILEDKFCEVIENKWPNLLQEILKKPRIKGISEFIVLNNEEILLLRLMTISMMLRIENTPGFDTIENTINDISDFFEKFALTSDSKVKFKKFYNTEVKHLLFLRHIYDLLVNKSNSQFMELTFKNSKLNYELYVINGDKNFDTSDTPCFKVINNFELTNHNNGIYFPLTPKIFAILRRDEKLSNTINVFEASEKEINYINWAVQNYSNKYIIKK